VEVHLIINHADLGDHGNLSTAVHELIEDHVI
jgi:hypothetical protein